MIYYIFILKYILLEVFVLKILLNYLVLYVYYFFKDFLLLMD